MEVRVMRVLTGDESASMIGRGIETGKSEMHCAVRGAAALVVVVIIIIIVTILQEDRVKLKEE